MIFKEAYKLIEKNEDRLGELISEVLGIWFPYEHSAHYMQSEGSAGLDELHKCIDSDYEMVGFEKLFEAYDKYYEKGEYDKIEEVVNSITSDLNTDSDK